MKISKEGKRIEKTINTKLKEGLLLIIQKSEGSKRITWTKAKKEIASWK